MIITIKSFCVSYEITICSFTICIFNENLTFSNNCAFLIKVCDIKFFFTFEFIKHFISRVLKNVTIVIVQIKTRNFRFRNFNFNVVTTNIRFKLFSSFLRDDFVFSDIRRIWNTSNHLTYVLFRHMNNIWLYRMFRWFNYYYCDDLFDFVDYCYYFLEYTQINLSARFACLIVSHYQLHRTNCFVCAKMFNFYFNRWKINFKIVKINLIIDAKIAKTARY